MAMAAAIRKKVFATVLPLFLLPPLAAEPRQDWALTVSLTKDSGDFGTDSTTRTTYIPVTIKRLFKRGDASLTMALLSVRTIEGNVILEGTTQRGSRNASANITTEGGLGDTVLRGRLYVIPELLYFPSLDVTAKVKIPTASRSEGLGTGEWDAGVGAEMAKRFLDRWMGYLDFGYTAVGDPPGTKLRNQSSYDFGAGYYFTKKLLGDVFYEERTALVEGQPRPRSLLLDISYKLKPTLKLFGGLEVGLSDGSADHGLTIGTSILF